jgi:aminoglycoside 2'-N-acetyltransferase I
MAELRTRHTAELTAEELRAIRVLLDEAFAGDITDDDYEHGLGGIHALVWEGPDLIGHGSVVMRRLLNGGRALRTGYVEAVGVRSDRRGQGHGAAVMQALERVIRGGYEIGALGSAEDAADFYTGRGWRPWTGTASVITPTGLRRTEDDEDCIYLLPVTAELVPGDLACDWRDGDPW